MLFLVETKIERETVSKNSNLILNQSDFAINNLKRLKLWFWYGIVYFDWNRGSTQFELLLSKDIIKDLVQALKLEHPAEHMQEGIHYLIT